MIAASGSVARGEVNYPLGIRPAFKLNPSSVIFTSEISSSAAAAKRETLADGTNYSAAVGGAKIYKLTVLSDNTNFKLTDVKYANTSIDTHTTIIVAPTGSITLTGVGSDIYQL